MAVQGKTTYGFPNRILRRLIDHPLDQWIEVFSSYIRSEHNPSADGLTRWADEEVAIWLHKVRMESDALPIERLRPPIGPNGSPGDIGAFTLMGDMYGFYRTGCHRVCEWRPGCYTTPGVLSDWGVPETCYGVLRTISINCWGRKSLSTKGAISSS